MRREVLYFIGMLTLVFFSMAVIAQTESAEAADFEIVNQFLPPGSSYGKGLAWDGTNLWMSMGGIPQRIYELTTSGAVVSSFDWPYDNDTQGPDGLAWDGEHLRAVSASLREILTLTREGGLVSFVATPENAPRGLAWDGTTLWLSDSGYWATIPNIESIYQLSRDGVLIDYFELELEGDFTTRDLAYDGTHLWLAMQTNQTIYKISVTGEILESYHLGYDLGIPGTPYGLSWDGSTLWLSTASPAYIYQLKPTTVPQGISGTLRDGGLPVSGVEVILAQPPSRQRTITDANGYYEFEEVASGGYKITIRGYKE